MENINENKIQNYNAKKSNNNVLHLVNSNAKGKENKWVSWNVFLNKSTYKSLPHFAVWLAYWSIW